MKQKTDKVGFLGMLLGILPASLFGNLLICKVVYAVDVVIRAGEATIIVGKNF